MKVVFDRQPLASGLALIHNIVSSASTMPILSHALIEAVNEEATIFGTDLEAFGRVVLKGRIDEAGKAAVNARLFSDIVKLLPEGEVTLEVSAGRMVVSCNRNKYQLTILPVEDFPEWPRIEPDTRLTLKQADLKRVLHNTLFAIPTRDPRKVLMGVLFELNDGCLTCVATDGRKLGKTDIEPISIEGSPSISAIVPESILSEIERAIGEEGEIELGFSERQVVFNLSSLCYIANRIEGTYPKYDAVIPQSFVREIQIQKTNLMDTINRAAILAERRHHSIILRFSNGQIDIQSQSFEDGSYEGTIETDYEGEPFRIAFNHQYLQEIFKIIPDSVVTMKIKENNAPVVFECESEANALFLVMPVRMTDLEGEMAEAGVEATES